MMKGKTEDELKALEKEDVLGLLGVPVGTMRLRCALLPLETLRNALGTFRRKSGAVLGDDGLGEPVVD
jgi:nitrogen fixation NifU-like protein